MTEKQKQALWGYKYTDILHGQRNTEIKMQIYKDSKTERQTQRDRNVDRKNGEHRKTDDIGDREINRGTERQ